jgi:hypothetical protein
MRSWQIRNILVTALVAACCGVAAAGAEDVSPQQQPASPDVPSVTKQSAAKVGSNTKKSTRRASKSSARPTAQAKPKNAAVPTKAVKTATIPKTVKAVAPATTAKVAAPANTTKVAAPANAGRAAGSSAAVKPGTTKSSPPVRVTGGNAAPTPWAGASEASAPDIELRGFKDRARWAPATVCADTHEKLQGTIRAIDKEASKSGDRVMIARMFAEFRIPVETIESERTRLSAPWGELVVAHTLRASAPGVTVDQLFDMREEGMGWGQIAHGLGLKQKEVVTAVHAEGRVIRGQSKPDGSPSRIAGFEPQVVGMDRTAPAGAPTPELGTGAVEAPDRESVEK